MPRSHNPLVALSIYLSKAGITDPDRILKDRDSYLHEAIHTTRGFLGSLYVRPSVVRMPRWVKFLEPSLDVTQLPIKSASASAVLLVQKGERVFAVAFGHGRHMLALESTDERFGLRVTLNAIDPRSIRSIDRKTFGAAGRRTREQLVSEDQIEAFGLDVERDLLRAVTGRPSDDALGRSMSGMDALSVTARFTLDNLPEFLDRFAELNEQTGYRERFPWVDNIGEVRDPLEIHRLDRDLIARINREGAEDVQLAVPDIVDWSNFGGFSFIRGSSAHLYEDLSWASYLDGRNRNTETLTLEHLQNDRVFFISSEQDAVVHSWSIYSCISTEVSLGGSVFVLNSGTWFRADSGFVNNVNTAIRQIDPGATRLPEFDHRDEYEYNLDVTARIADICCLDRTHFRRGGGRSQIEVCDLLTRRGSIVYVKRYRGSASLSHLFAQGYVSAELLMADPEFRAQVNAALPPGYQLGTAGAFDSRDYEIDFAVITKPKTHLSLPFFSRVNLRNVHGWLNRMGYRVALSQIPSVEH